MTDREMLELAARAAGLPWDQWVIDGDDRWDPLKHKADAFDLMVRMNLLVMPYPLDKCVRVTRLDQPDTVTFWKVHNNDPATATMLAITRAAAEIGRALNTTGEQK